MSTFSDPAFQRRLNSLRVTDNVTNWRYLAREYLFLGLAIGLPIGFFEVRDGWGFSWWWNIPVAVIAVVIIGAEQHRLTTLAHEASHYLLFRNRLLNEFISDWFCMFPMLSSTHHYRVQHLAHHQYVNDPERDPDLTQMEASGHRFRFPMSKRRFVWEGVIKQLLWFPKLIRYIRVRAKFNATGGGSGPYVVRGKGSAIAVAVGVLYLLSLVAMLTGLTIAGDPFLLISIPMAMLIGIIGVYALIPERFFRQTLIRREISARWMTFLRLTQLTLVFTLLAWLTWWTGRPWWLYYLVLWIAPIVTTFSFFMILRQVVQHGNGGTDRLTNTRIFRVGGLIRAAVFPLGMDYHLPHHLFPLVPHYRLRRLHELLLEVDAYQHGATVIEGYFFPKSRPPQSPTVLEALAAEPSRTC
jgi:fatty acid desaturase